MAKKGYICTTCGSKKQKLTPALEFGFYKRRELYEEQRCIEGVSDICQKCDAFTFFLDLDDNSSKKPDVVLDPGSIKYKDKMPISILSGDSNRSRSCAPKVSSYQSSRRTRSTGRVQQKPIYEEISPSESDFRRHCKNTRLIYEYSAYDASFFDDDETDIDNDAKDYETDDDDDIYNCRLKETRSSILMGRRKKSILKTSSKKKDKNPKNDLAEQVKQKKQLVDKLNGMKECLNSECERAEYELKQLEFDAIVEQELKKNKRESGGAHFILSETSDSCTKWEKQTKSKSVTQESHIMRSMKEEELPKSTPYMESNVTPICSSLIGERSSLTRSQSILTISSDVWRCINKIPQICYDMSSVQRAIFQGFAIDPRLYVRPSKLLDLKRGQKIEYIAEPPFRQFTTLPCNRKEILYLLDIKPEASNKKSVPQELFISRAPILCPDHECRRITFISDFNRHLLYDHRRLTMERINVRESKTFYLDSTVILLNKAKCHVLYLVAEKIIDTHSNKLRELLPVLVMTSRVRLSEMFGTPTAVARHGVSPETLSTEMLVIWLTSFIPKDHKIRGTICLWSTRKSQLVDSLYVHTSDVYDIRDPQDLCSICSSSKSLVIPDHIVKRMTKHGKNFLAIQTQVY